MITKKQAGFESTIQRRDSIKSYLFIKTALIFLRNCGKCANHIPKNKCRIVEGNIAPDGMTLGKCYLYIRKPGFWIRNVEMKK